MGLAVLAAPGGVVVGAVMVTLGISGYFLTDRAVRGIRVSDSGVVIMNPTRSTEVAWADLERFSIGSRGMYSRTGIAHLRDGSSVAMWGVQGPNPLTRPGESSAERQVDALNARLRDVTADRSGRTGLKCGPSQPCPGRVRGDVRARVVSGHLR
jgi:hypothetical protein